MVRSHRPRIGKLAVALAVALVLPNLACELDTPPKGHGTPGNVAASAPAEAVARARVAIQENRTEEAQQVLTGVLEKDPTNAQALALRGVAMMREGKLYGAVKDLAAAAQIAPSVDIYFNLGNVLQQGGFYDRAAVAYRAALELSPDDPEVLNNLGSALLYMQRIDEAQGVLQRVVQLRPSDPQAYTNLGISYERDKDYDAAESQFFKALEVDPGYWPAQFNLAKVYDVAGRDALAAEHYRRYLKLRPDAPDRNKIDMRATTLGGAEEDM